MGNRRILPPKPTSHVSSKRSLRSEPGLRISIRGGSTFLCARLLSPRNICSPASSSQKTKNFISKDGAYLLLPCVSYSCTFITSFHIHCVFKIRLPPLVDIFLRALLPSNIATRRSPLITRIIVSRARPPLYSLGSQWL